MSEETNERILEAAQYVFAYYGYEAPLCLVAKKAGVAKSLIVWYFGSKKKLVERVAFESLPGDIAQMCLSKGLKGNELIRCFIETFMKKYGDDINQRLLIETMAFSMRDKKLNQELAKFCDNTISKLASGIYGSDTPENRVRVRILFGSLMCYALNPIRVSPELYADILEKVVSCQGLNHI